MKRLTEEDKRKNSERHKAIFRGEIRPEYVGVPDEFKNDPVETEERNNHSIGYLYAKGLYLAGHRPKPSIYGESKKDFQELMTELTTLASENKKSK